MLPFVFRGGLRGAADETTEDLTVVVVGGGVVLFTGTPEGPPSLLLVPGV